MLALFVATLPALVFESVPPHEHSILAVFDVEDVTEDIGLTSSTIDQLTYYLATKMAEDERYSVLALADVRRALETEKQQSCAKHFNPRECLQLASLSLRADKALATQVGRVGNRCAVTASLFDVSRGASQAATSKHVTCDTDALLPALDDVTTAIKARITGTSSPAWPIWTSLGVAGAAGTTGLVLFFSAAKNARARNQSPDVAGFNAYDAAARRQVVAADVAFGIGATALATALVWWLVEPGAEPGAVDPSPADFAMSR